MPSYIVKCSDGSDPECEGTITVDIGFIGLTDAQLHDFSVHYGDSTSTTIELSPEQIQANRIELDKDGMALLQKNGHISLARTGRSFHAVTVCSACASIK